MSSWMERSQAEDDDEMDPKEKAEKEQNTFFKIFTELIVRSRNSK